MHRARRAVQSLFGTALLVLLFAMSPAAHADAGDLDPSFGGDGRVTTDLAPGSTTIWGVRIQGDGKIVAAGCASSTADGCIRGRSSNDFALARYRADGSLDRSFGHGGRVRTDLGGQADEARDLAIQGDGKLVAAGYGYSGTIGGFAVARYDPDGSLDPSFGEQGVVVTDFSGSGGFGFALALQWDGKIVVVGVSSGDFAVARYLPDGTLDPSFGVGGTVKTDLAGPTYDSTDIAHAVVIQGNGKIVVAGSAVDENCCATSNFALVRYKSDGTLDDSFGDNGKVITSVGEDDQANGVALQWNGKIVVVGTASMFTTPRFAVVRYRRDGSRDPHFGTGGLVLTDFGGSSVASAVAVQGNGRIVVAGSAATDSGYDFAVARYQPTGTLDGDFGTGGTVTTDFAGRDDVGRALALQGNGKIVVAGSAQVGDGFASQDFALARYL